MDTDALDNIKDAISSLTYVSESMEDHLQQVINSRSLLDEYSTMFEMFCPFKVGDKVRLSRDVTEWKSCQHFTTKGAEATVYYRRFSKNSSRFFFGLQFDGDSWVSSLDGSVHPTEPDRRFLFYISEDYLEPVTSSGTKLVELSDAEVDFIREKIDIEAGRLLISSDPDTARYNEKAINKLKELSQKLS